LPVVIEIVPVTTPALTKAFVELPYQLYRRSACWVPPLRRDEYRRLSPKHNPFHEHAEIDLWIARETGGRVAGRIAAIHDRLHDDTHKERVTWFGFFEADTADTASRLLATVERRARERGSAIVRGPANPSLNESAGLLIDAFDQEPSIMMPYNPPEYARFIESAGYAKVKDLLAWRIDVSAPNDRIARVADRVIRRHGVVVRPLAMKHFYRDLALMTDIYKAAWQDNWGFVPPTDAELRQMAVDLKPVLDPEMVLFAEMNGTTVACSVCVPNFNQVLKRMGGNLLPFGIVHFLRRKSIVNELRLLLLGVLPAARRIGLYPLMIAENHRRAVAGGYRHAELSWTLEDNDDVNAGIEATGGRRHKTYRLYDKPLG
jgi:hypothetical protein